MEEILKFLGENPTFYLATVEGDQPKVRPFGFFMAHENRLYFGTGTHKKVYRQLQVNPNVEVCTASPKGQWIRIRGKAVFDQRPETAAKAFETMPVLETIYNEKNRFRNGPLLPGRCCG